MATKPKGPANRGKSAERQVHDVLDTFNSRIAGFCFNRVPDAHAAGGRFPAQAGDFQAFLRGEYMPRGVDSCEEIVWNFSKHGPHSRNFIIEVKETAHEYRLPSKNYDEGKVGRVQKRVWAGTEAVVAVLHTGSKVWRLVPFEVFTERKPSWDLTIYPVTADIEGALAKFLGIDKT